MSTEHQKKVAELLKQARIQHGLTQNEVAEKAGISTNTYARIERAEQEPKSESLRKLVKALNIDPSKVL